MIRPLILACLVALGSVAAPACASSTRESTIKAALVAVDASKEAYVAYDAHEQGEIVAAATSLEDGKAKLAAYRGKRAGVVKALTVAYQAIATAAQLNDDPSLAALGAAVNEVIATLRSLTGGAP